MEGVDPRDLSYAAAKSSLHLGAKFKSGAFRHLVWPLKRAYYRIYSVSCAKLTLYRKIQFVTLAKVLYIHGQASSKPCLAEHSGRRAAL